MATLLALARSALLACAVAGACSGVARADELERAYTAAVRQLAHGPGVTRADGFIWAYDSAQLLRFAAVDRDLTRYLELRDAIVKRFVITSPSDPEARDDVTWRIRDGAPPEASGTTEALALADALLVGADAFGRPDDRALARRLTDAYMRHATTERGIWFIRNYYTSRRTRMRRTRFWSTISPTCSTRPAMPTAPRIRTRSSTARWARPDSSTNSCSPRSTPRSPPRTSRSSRPTRSRRSPTPAASRSTRSTAGRRSRAASSPSASPTASRCDASTTCAPAARESTENAGTPAFACLTRLAVRLGDDDARRKLDAPLRANAQTQLRAGNVDASTGTAVIFALRQSDR